MVMAQYFARVNSAPVLGGKVNSCYPAFSTAPVMQAQRNQNQLTWVKNRLILKMGS